MITGAGSSPLRDRRMGWPETPPCHPDGEPWFRSEMWFSPELLFDADMFSVSHPDGVLITDSRINGDCQHIYPGCIAAVDYPGHRYVYVLDHYDLERHMWHGHWPD